MKEILETGTRCGEGYVRYSLESFRVWMVELFGNYLVFPWGSLKFHLIYIALIHGLLWFSAM